VAIWWPGLAALLVFFTFADDFGFRELNVQQAEDLYELICGCYQHAATGPKLPTHAQGPTV